MPETTSIIGLVTREPATATLLEDSGYAVFSTDSISAVARAHAAAVVCDADHVNWREALVRLSHLNVPVIFVSSQADERLWVQMLEAGAFDLLQKPCRAADLKRAVALAAENDVRAFSSIA